MKNASARYAMALASAVALAVILTSCYGTYKKSVGSMLWHLTSLSSEFDDINTMAPATIAIDSSFAFSSNRLTKGGSYDIVRASLSGSAAVTTQDYFMADSPLSPMEFGLSGQRSDSFMPMCNSAYDERGPWMRYEGIDPAPDLTDTALISNPYDPEGANYHYFFDSDRPSGPGGSLTDRNIYYYNVARNAAAPQAVAFNSDKDDAYPCLISLADGLLFSSNRDGGMGGWDIYLLKGMGPYASVGELAMDPAATATPIASLNSDADDICPFFLDGALVFASKRGGKSDYDLYYATYDGSAWTAPKPLAAADLSFEISSSYRSLMAGSPKGTYTINGATYTPSINSGKNEFRPILIKNKGFYPGGAWMVFSSDRTIANVSQGGYDLYLAWLSDVDFPGIQAAMTAWNAPR